MNQNSEKCLDIRDASGANGAVVQQYAWNSQTSQQLRLVAAAYSGQGIVAVNSNKSLSVGLSLSNLGKVTQQSCSATQKNQAWLLK